MLDQQLKALGEELQATHKELAEIAGRDAEGAERNFPEPYWNDADEQRREVMIGEAKRIVDKIKEINDQRQELRRKALEARSQKAKQ